MQWWTIKDDLFMINRYEMIQYNQVRTVVLLVPGEDNPFENNMDTVIGQWGAKSAYNSLLSTLCSYLHNRNKYRDDSKMACMLFYKGKYQTKVYYNHWIILDKPGNSGRSLWQLLDVDRLRWQLKKDIIWKKS